MRLFERIAGDLTYLGGALRALRMTTPIAKHPGRVFPHVVEDLAERFSGSVALLSEKERLTYSALNARANRYARWALDQGVQKGDAVSLLMPNRPEYMALWLGVIRAGGAVSLLNTNLTGHPLAHCINIVLPKHVVVAAELSAAFASARPFLSVQPKLWSYGEADDGPRLDREIESYPSETLSAAERRPLTIEDPALFIYTSGTTGLPKAANVNHYRLMLATHGFAGVMNTSANDRMYDCLPMFHTVGGVVATGALLVRGGSVFIRDKFSAREFWDEIVRWDCTMFQYIGELCRYLLNTPPSESERKHRIKLCCGNGLRPDVWIEFAKRFRIPKILEFYAATEGNVTLFNFEGRPGSVGRVPWFLASRFPTEVVRFDVEKEEPVRGPDGFCMRCAPNETGEVIGRILNDPSRPSARFEGYADKAATERKILRNAFEKGDVWFRTGDLMKKDENGYFFFIDRVGDTFRWKGENVATSEVSEALTGFPGVQEVNVYGVTIPGHDGRAGMAAVRFERDFDLAAFRAHLVKALPDYARPVFLRIRRELDVTATFKQRKVDLVKQGYDPSQTADALYFNDAKKGEFVPLDSALYDSIVEGKVRV